MDGALARCVEGCSASKTLKSIVGLAKVRECATALLHVAKRQGVPVFLVGHVTKVREVHDYFLPAKTADIGTVPTKRMG